MFRPKAAWARFLTSLAALGFLSVASSCSPSDSATDAPRAEAGETASSERTGLLVGADISFLPELEDHGAVYSDERGVRDLLAILADHGFNAVRLKLWHTPEAPYNTLEQVMGMARRIDDAGMVFLLDFHYSDSWADPQKQIKPAAWEGLPFGVLADSVYTYTRAVVQALSDQGTPPEIVQIGNEIRPGMLWPEGRVDGEFDTPMQWDRLAMLLEAGIRGARDGAPDSPPRVMIHFDNGAKNEMGRAFFDQLVERELDFDLIGLSFYPKWHGTLEELRTNLSDLASRYQKEVVVVETSYPWTMEWKDEAPNIMGTEEDLHEGYAPTKRGQAAFLSEVREAVESVPEDRGAGIFYWAPEWVAVEGVDSHWENATLFDFEGRALPGLNAFSGR
ncbi:MAG: arabinogalactan endo-1,4-beta-galactosidase [Gemmatimonadota bacterium]